MKNAQKLVLVTFLALFCLIISTSKSHAATRVGGYYRSNGTYVNSYYRSTSDSTRWNNYSTSGNYNPYTGSKGYTSPYKSYSSYSYPSYRSYSYPSYSSRSSYYRY